MMLMAYMCAAGGWGLDFIAPPIVMTIMIAAAKRPSAFLVTQLRNGSAIEGRLVRGRRKRGWLTESQLNPSRNRSPHRFLQLFERPRVDLARAPARDVVVLAEILQRHRIVD